MQKIAQTVSKAIHRLAQADMVFFIMPALMLLLFTGTIAQKEIGLYAAHKTFFSSFVIWAGPVPLPGGYSLIALLCLFLIFKFIFHSEWSGRKSGIILTHLGVLVLLVGGFLTALTARETYMIIAQGQSSPYIYDYTKRELSVRGEKGSLHRIAFSDIKDGQIANLPFPAKIIASCANCQIITRQENESFDDATQYRSFARFMALTPKAPDIDPEANLGGVTFEITDSDKDTNGLYIAFEGMPEPIIITHKDQRYQIIFGKKQDILPFQLRLEKFTRDTYPGTDTPRAFSSDMTVLDGDLQWPVRIEMNAPLRYKGYTFFQSSFERSEAGDMTILAVVQNKGRIFPYLGTAIIALGLIVHILISTRKRPAEKTTKKTRQNDRRKTRDAK